MSDTSWLVVAVIAGTLLVVGGRSRSIAAAGSVDREETNQ